MAVYSLIASESTSQVLSPTIVLPVQYLTIQTSPSGVIASAPISQDSFDAGGAGLELTRFAANIESLMALPHVVAAHGSQLLDDSGLLKDTLVVTVRYVPAGVVASAVTADAVVPVGLLLGLGDAHFGGTPLEAATAIIDAEYQKLVAAAGGE